jgi:hypothetical protein
MKTQRSQQAENAVGDTLGDLRKDVFSGEGMVARDVDSPAAALNQALLHQGIEPSPGNPAGFQVGRPDDAHAADHFDFGFFDSGSHSA